MEKIKVGILGATGMVGQRFISLLDKHPYFEVTELAASERSAGKTYAEAVQGRWKVDGDIPVYTSGMVVKECKPGLDCKLVFSALESSVAGPIEEAFAKAGYVVSSNSRNHRMTEDVPLLIPEVNPDHLNMLVKQKERLGGKGFMVTNPNCSTIMLALALKPLQDAFGINKVIVTTMQALSGAGFPGVPSLDILDNIVPYIGGEEEKMESETLKILGNIEGDAFEDALMSISAHCNRVATKDGHLECVSVALETMPENLDAVKDAFRNFQGMPQSMDLPTAPKSPIIVRTEEDRPQPRLDRDASKGMAISIGRIRNDPVIGGVKFIVLGHNTIRGAAGAAILNAELMYKKELLGG